MDNNLIGEELEEVLYDEMDNFASEILDGDSFLNYINSKSNFYEDNEKALEEFDEKTKNNIKSFGDYYYYYLDKYSNNYNYKLKTKGYTKGLKKLIADNDINPNVLNINWDKMEKKENKYQDSLIDILYAIVNYEIGKLGYCLFGITLGYDSVFYYIVKEDKYNRIVKNQNVFKVFDVKFLETIYGEIYEVVGDFGIDEIEKGDFLEYRNGIYETMFSSEYTNLALKNIDENDENQVRLVL